MIGSATLLVFLFAGSAPADDVLRDPRDGETYRTVRIAARRWMAENLRTQTPDSRCYAGSVRNCFRYGRLYTFAEAVAACPAGWRLPSDEDWMRLEEAIGVPPPELRNDRHRGAESQAGNRLKPGGDTGFGALYAGYEDPHRREFRRLDEAAAFWTSTLEGADDISPVAWHRDLNVSRSASGAPK